MCFDRQNIAETVVLKELIDNTQLSKTREKRTRPRSCIYLLLTVGDVADPAPGKRLVGIEFAVGAVDVKTLSVHTK